MEKINWWRKARKKMLDSFIYPILELWVAILSTIEVINVLFYLKSWIFVYVCASICYSYYSLWSQVVLTLIRENFSADSCSFWHKLISDGFFAFWHKMFHIHLEFFCPNLESPFLQGALVSLRYFLYTLHLLLHK